MRKSEEHIIAKEIAQKITGKRNQHETAIIVGDKGKGKSWGALSLAYEVSSYVAEIKGGKPSDYFTLDNVAIITKDEVIRVLKNNMKQFNIVIFDDIGVGWSNRDFATKFSKIMNGIFQVFRTKNIFLIMTVPDKSYIDKLPREGVHYFMEVTDSYFDEGFIEVKVKESKKLMQSGDIHYPFVNRDGVRYVRHLIMTAPDRLTTPYEKRRTDIEKISSDRGIAELEQLELDSDGNQELKRAMKKTEMLRPAICAMAEQHYTQREIGKMVGCSQQLVSQVLNNE